jgi:hypothetical protein
MQSLFWIHPSFQVHPAGHINIYQAFFEVGLLSKICPGFQLNPQIPLLLIS